MEADIALKEDPDRSKADLIDGSIGEESLFHETFGFYAQGVSIESAILAPGWEDRLVRFATPDTAGVVAWCLSLEDLWVSKALAGRPKDLEFCPELLAMGVVDVLNFEVLCGSSRGPIGQEERRPHFARLRYQPVQRCKRWAVRLVVNSYLPAEGLSRSPSAPA
ncbi:MAG: DUF6036 family nucleotidyltransferase [Acidimicrobiia bacterium]